MNSISPNSPLLTLTVRPEGDTTTRAILAQFHPIMKSRGFGNFEMEQEGFYQASKSGDGFFSSQKFVFAEVAADSVVINIDGHSIFGLKGVEDEMNKIKDEYESRISCKTELLGPNYSTALISNLIYTIIPIYASAGLVMAFMYQLGFKTIDLINIGLYATLGIIGAKTRFWVEQRRKQRPIWMSVLFLFLAAPVILGVVALILWALNSFA